jgi:hypothetical protein
MVGFFTRTSEMYTSTKESANDASRLLTVPGALLFVDMDVAHDY